MMARHIHLRVALLFLATTFSLCCLEGLAQNISLVGQSDPFPSTHKYGDVWAEGDIACVGAFSKYIANPSYGVAIFSITNPAAPVLLANYNPTPSGNNQFEQGVVRNSIGYFANWSGTNGGMHIVSLTNPASPLLLSTISKTNGTTTNGFERVHTMFLDDNFLYLADHLTKTVKVFNVSSPALPVFVRNIGTTDTLKIHQITIANGRLFTSGWGGRTDIYDVSDVATQAPLLGYIDSGSQSHSAWPTADGNYLVSCREISGGDVRIFNISNPASPTLITTLTTAGVGIQSAIPHNPVVIGNLLYISWYQNGLQVFDISNPAQPVRVGSYDTFPGSITTSFEGNWGVYPNLGINKILLSDMQSGLLVLDASSVLTATNFAPILLIQPTSQVVTQGNTVTFFAAASGSTLSYQWRLNGTAVSGATTNTLVLEDIQSSSGGAYTLVVTNSAGSITSSVANLSVIVSETYQTIFLDDFETNSSSRWMIFAGSGTGGDYTATWAHDYGTYFSSYNNSNIPSAPNSTNGTTRGVKLVVNSDATAAFAGVSLYPSNQNFSGAYKLKFDMWMNYPGGPGGSGSDGSTETATFGLNHAGNRVNWASTTANPSDGVWFGVTGEGGDASDYRAYVGNTSSSPSSLSFAASGIAASGATSAANTASYFQGIFPSPAYESAGAPGKHWVEVELGQDTNKVVTWKINGNLIAQRTNTSIFTNGTIMIGYMDLFTSIASPAADAFVVFDNVRVEVPSFAVAPAIVAQPEDQTVLPESSVTFTVAATGTAPLSYQWRFNDTEISGATNSTFIRAAEPEHAGHYSVVVSNSAGSATSAEAHLSLINDAEISDVSASPGKTTALISWTTTTPADSQVEYEPHESHEEPSLIFSEKGRVVPKGHGNYNQVSNLDTNLVTQHRILLTGLEPGTEYGFQVISEDGTSRFLSAGYHFTTVATNYPAPVLISSPQSSIKIAGASATFSANVSGQPYLIHQWKKSGTDLTDGPNISGSRTANLTLASVSPGDAGSYHIVVSNEFGAITSASATLTVITSPVITVQPQSRTVFLRGDALFSATVLGSQPVSLQWRKNAVKINGATNSALSLLNIATNAAAAYTLIASNVSGVVTSSVANLTVKTDFSQIFPIAGKYNGLFYETNRVTHQSSGFVTLQLRTNAAFTGKLITDGDTVSFSGKVTTDGTSVVPVKRAGIQKSNLLLNLTFDLTGGSDVLTGNVGGLGWSAPLVADRDVWFKNQEAGAYTNSYTMLLPGFTNAASGPSGYGWGTLKVKTNGTVALIGMTADDRKMNQTVPISENGQWPFYAPMYPVKRIYTDLTVTNTIKLKTNNAYYLGSVLGWLTFTNHAPTGKVSWIKTSWTNIFYPNGHTNVSTLLGSLYTPPVTDSPIHALKITNGVVTVTSGNLNGPFTNDFIWTDKNTFTTIATNNNRLKISFTKSTGRFSGSFIHPAKTNKATLFSGAVLQKQNFGGGYFMGTNQAGFVRFQGK